MRRAKTAIGLLSSLSLLALQLSGLHAHADENGFIGTPKTGISHTHSIAHQHDGTHSDSVTSGDHDHGGPSHVHDYDDVRDVSLFELLSGDSKQTIAIPALIPKLVNGAHIQTYEVAEIAYPVLSGRHTRWRPPLRAPPQPTEI